MWFIWTILTFWWIESSELSFSTLETPFNFGTPNVYFVMNVGMIQEFRVVHITCLQKLPQIVLHHHTYTTSQHIFSLTIFLKLTHFSYFNSWTPEFLRIRSRKAWNFFISSSDSQYTLPAKYDSFSQEKS